jgi:NAD+ kinase
VREGRSRRMRRLLEEGDRTVETLKRTHHDHVLTIQTVRAALGLLGVRASFRYLLSRPNASGYDLVVTLGGDGTLLWASHSVGPETPMLAINTAPKSSVGYFCAADASDLGDVLRDAIAGRLKATTLTRMRVVVDGEVASERVLNDVLFSAASPAATTRCIVSFRGREENQKSSGVWVGPAAGSTAAQRSAGGKVLPIASQRIQYVVREPYVDRDRKYRLVQGTFGPREFLEIRSKTADGCMWIDGPHREHKAPWGSVIRLSSSDEPLSILGLRLRDGRKERG